MTILTVVNDVCDVVSLSRFETVYGNDDPSALTMLALAKEGGDEIARRADWQGLLKTGEIAATVDNLPEDFQRLTLGGAVRTANGQFVRSVTNSGQWAVLSTTNTNAPFFFIKGQTILFAPTAAGVDARIDYVSKNWIITDPYGEVDKFTSGDDKTVFPERLLTRNLIWRWRRKQGLSFDDQLAEFEADLQQEIEADRGVS